MIGIGIVVAVVMVLLVAEILMSSDMVTFVTKKLGLMQSSINSNC